MDFEIEGVERGNGRPCVFSGGFAGLASRARAPGISTGTGTTLPSTSGTGKRHEHSAPNLQAYGMDVSQVPH